MSDEVKQPDPFALPPDLQRQAVDEEVEAIVRSARPIVVQIERLGRDLATLRARHAAAVSARDALARDE
jgi:hypothetical protein